MAFGLTPARGPWEYRRSTISSAATFVKGCVLAMHPTRVLRQYVSTDSAAYGIAMNDSANSLPVGIVTVAIPFPGCTAYGDLLTGEVNSSFSEGQGCCAHTSGNFNSFISATWTSAFSTLYRVARHLSSTDQSKASRIEVSFVQDNWIEYGSASTSTFKI
jgi:hypothetical protein